MNNSEHRISIQPGYVLVERPPNFEVIWSEQPALLMELSTFCEASDCRKVIVLGPRTKVKLSTIEAFDLGQEIAKLGLRIAVVELHDASKEKVEFLENVATNRGGPIQFFDSEQQAKDWLGIS